MANLDVESVLDSIKTFLVANLNTQITALNTEKADSVSLATVANDAYILQTLNNQVANFDPFVFYGVLDPSPEGIGPATSKDYTFQVILMLVDSGDDVEMGRRLLRYSRVLTDLFESKYDRIDKRLKFKVRGLAPVSFSLINSEHDYVAVGVELTETIA